MALTKIPSSLLDTSSGINGLIYPTSDGTSGQFLKTDGSGNLTFATITTYTDSDVETYLDGGTSTPTFASATVSGALTVTGDLNITGDINSYNVADLDVTDQTITLGAGQIEANSGGSGIIVDGSNASILWDETNDTFDINKGIDVTGTAEMDGFTVDSGSGAEIIISRDDTSLVNGDFIGGIKFGTNDISTAYGTPPHYSAGIKAKASGTVGLMDMHLYAGQTNDAYEEDTPSMTLSYNGDISFYEDTGTTAKFFWDASAESLGIGLTSPQAKVHTITGGSAVYDTSNDEFSR